MEGQNMITRFTADFCGPPIGAMTAELSKKAHEKKDGQKVGVDGAVTTRARDS